MYRSEARPKSFTNQIAATVTKGTRLNKRPTFRPAVQPRRSSNSSSPRLVASQRRTIQKNRRGVRKSVTELNSPGRFVCGPKRYTWSSSFQVLHFRPRRFLARDYLYRQRFAENGGFYCGRCTRRRRRRLLSGLACSASISARQKRP